MINGEPRLLKTGALQPIKTIEGDSPANAMFADFLLSHSDEGTGYRFLIQTLDAPVDDGPESTDQRLVRPPTNRRLLRT